MAKPPRPWTVVPHGPIEAIDDNLWGVESPVPGIPGASFPRRMMIIRRTDGRLLLHNAVPLDEAAMKQLAELGAPSLLVLPSPFHCIDGHAMRARLGAKVYGPGPSLSALRERVEVDGPIDALPPNPKVRFVALDGVRSGEGVFLVESGDGERVNLVVCDVVLNVPSIPGFWGWVWKVMGFTGGPLVGPLWLKRAVADRAALKAHLLRIAETPKLARLVPSHGVVAPDAAATLRAVAAKL